MKIPRLAAFALLVLSSLAATGVAPTKTELEGMYDKAFREFDANHYDEALKALDAIDARQPDLAESKNLRGVILMRKGDYDKAEAALKQALEIEPKFWNASFNLSEIPFLKKDWAEARNRFEALVAGNSDEMKGETSLLIQYKILLTFVLQGKENMVDWIVNKFEGEKDSPALYYSNAAIALSHKNQKEAKEWMDAADKHYPSSLNKLFAESFYEIGWLTKPAGESRAAIEITSTAEHAARMKADAQANFERAERAFHQRDFPGALSLLDLADEGVPNQAATLNLRGEVLMEQQKFDQAEEAFRQAFNADPKFREAQYNLAQIPFKKKDYTKARERLETLFSQTPGGEKNQAAQLIKYKIFMTLLLEGNDSQAQQMMDQFKFTGDTPALYYAQAAWAFKHENADQGSDWIKSARKIYSPALNVVFADAFYDLGWLQRAPETAPPTTSLAQADASPPAATPAMRFGGAESVTAPVVTGGQAMPAVTPAVVAKSSPAATNAPVASSAAAAIAASSPVAVLAGSASLPVVAKTVPGAVAKSTPPQIVPKAAAVMTAKSPPPQVVAKNVPAPKASSPTVVTSSAAVSPAATALAPARIREWSQPTFAEMIDRAENPQTLLFGGLVLAGVMIFGWLIVQQVRRHGSGSSLYEAPLPVTEPRFGKGDSGAIDERRVSRENLDGGPPKLSLQLTGSDPAVRKTIVPPTASTTSSAAGKSVKSTSVSPNEASGTVSEVRPILASAKSTADKSPSSVPPSSAPVSPATAVPNQPQTPVVAPTTPLRDAKEVSLGGAPKSAPVPVAIPPILAPMPARAAATAPPAILAQPKPPAVEPMKPVVAAQEKPPVVPPIVPSLPREEPVGQGQPVPKLTAAAPVPEVIAPKTPDSKPGPQAPARIEPEKAAIAAIAGTHATPQSNVESPSFTSKITTTKPTTPALTTPATMPESTPITAINTPRPAAPAGGQGAPAPTPAQSAGNLQTAVQLTFSLEIASLQLTPNFKMGTLQLKPISKIVSMRLAPSAQPQPAMNLQVTFELASVQLGAGAALGTVRLTPSSSQRPTPVTTPSFEISGLQLISSAAASPVQLTPTQQDQASVLMTASFQIATVEFSPAFEIASVVLNSTSKNVAVQLPGAGPSSIEGAPVFEIGNVQLSANNEIGMIQLNPLGTGRRA
ncbi:MAG: tetratricopeptide repeat protein [Chthoniobacterales bacterium]|nr:tetratricopeptide repeat protein [Chthoniobacterales bacterium]